MAALSTIWLYPPWCLGLFRGPHPLSGDPLPSPRRALPTGAMGLCVRVLTDPGPAPGPAPLAGSDSRLCGCVELGSSTSEAGPQDPGSDAASLSGARVASPNQNTLLGT